MAGITETANGEKSQIDFKEITSFIVEELSKRNLLRKGATTYQNTESLLYKYNDLKKSVEDREEEIEEIKTTGLRGKSKSIFKIPEGSHSDYDTIEEDIINGLISDIKKTQLIINRIDRILKKFKSDKYIDIIKLKYFENKTQQELATMCRAMEEMRNETVRERNIECALEMLADGMPYEKVAKYSKLTLEEVKALDTKKPA